MLMFISSPGISWIPVFGFPVSCQSVFMMFKDRCITCWSFASRQCVLNLNCIANDFSPSFKLNRSVMRGSMKLTFVSGILLFSVFRAVTPMGYSGIKKRFHFPGEELQIQSTTDSIVNITTPQLPVVQKMTVPSKKSKVKHRHVIPHFYNDDDDREEQLTTTHQPLES